MLVLVDSEKRQLIEAVHTFWPDFSGENVKIIITPLNKNCSIHKDDVLILNACLLSEIDAADISNASDIHIYYADESPSTLLPKTTVVDQYKGEQFSTLFMNRYKKYLHETQVQKKQIKQLLELNQKLTHSLDTFEVELMRVKKIYKQMVPVRKLLYKGVRLKSKYLTGESSGGEFFDVIEKGRQILLVMHSCNSYLASSSFISMFSVFKDLNSIELPAIKNFVISIENELEVIRTSIGKKIQSEVLILKLDLSTLDYELWNFGGYRVFNGDVLEVDHMDVSISADLLDKVRFRGKFQRESRFMIFSPGLKNNFRTKEDYINESHILKDMHDRESEDVLDEFAIRLKANTESDFVKFDTSMIVFEVDKNAIFQI